MEYLPGYSLFSDNIFNFFFFIKQIRKGGHLLSYVMDGDEPWKEDQCRFYGGEILLALEFMHSQNIVYRYFAIFFTNFFANQNENSIFLKTQRDLKLENILLDMDGHIRLTDFGLSVQLKNDTDRVYSMSGLIFSFSLPFSYLFFIPLQIFAN